MNVPGTYQERIAIALERLADFHCPAPAEPFSDSWHVFIQVCDPSGQHFTFDHMAHGDNALEAADRAVGYVRLDAGWQVRRAWAVRQEYVTVIGPASRTPEWTATHVEQAATR